MISGMSIAFGCLGIIAWIYLMVVRPTYIPSFILGFISGVCCTFLALIFGVPSIVRLARRRYNGFLCTICASLCSISVLMMIYSVYSIAIPQIKMSQRSAKMADIGIALKLYMREHSGHLPDGSIWCDALLEDGFVTPKHLNKHIDGSQQISYALNVDVLIGSEKPDDIVLMFESKPGWNLVGGKELLFSDKYKGGCWILFGGMFIKYIYPEEFENLRWTK